jgi:hypothetical protein
MSRSKVVAVEWRSSTDTVGIVLMHNEHDGYKAYIGVAKFAIEKLDINYIKANGAKLTYEEAAPFFPFELSHEYHRKGTIVYDGDKW